MDDCEKSKQQLISEIQDLRNRYNSITDAVTDYFFTVFIKNEEVVKTVHGPACFAVTGYSSDKFRENPYLWINMVHENDRSIVNQQASDIISNLKLNPIEHRIVRKDGMVRWVKNTPVPHFSDRGDLSSYDGLIRDITEQKESEIALQESEKLYRTLTDTSPDAVTVTDLNGKITFVSKNSVKLHGCDSEEELLNKNALELIAPEDHEKVKVNIQKTLDEGSVKNIEYKMVKKDGSLFIGELNATLVKTENGEPSVFIATVRDVTERKIAEKKLQNRSDFERTIANISTHFVTSQDFDDTINYSLGKLGKLSRASRSYLFLFNEDGTKMSNTHEWCDKGVSSQINNLQNLPSNLFPWWMKKLKNNEIIHITNVNDLPNDAKAEKKVLESQDIISLLVLPINCSKKLEGFIGFDNVRETGAWKEEDFDLLRISAQMVSTAFERKRARLELQKREKYYRAIVQDQTEFIVRWRPDGIRTFVNESYCRYLGKSYDDLVGKTIFLAIKEEDREAFLQKIKKLTPLHNFVSEEHQLLHPNGSIRTIQWTDRAIFNDTDELIELQSVGRDVTEQRKAESALQESEDKFRTLADESPNMIFINLKGKVLYANKKCEELGYSREKFYDPNFKFLSLIAPESQELIKGNFQRHSIGEEVPPYEYSLVSKSGDKLDAIITTKLIPYQGDKAILGIITDITEQKRVQEALTKSEAFYRDVIENAAGVPFRLIFDDELGDGYYDYIGTGIKNLIGFNVEEFSEKIFHEQIINIYPRLPDMPTDSRECRELMRQKKLKHYQADILIITKTGEKKWINDSSLPLLDDKTGEVIGSFGILLDITARKNAEENLRISEERFNLALEATSDGLWDTNLKTKEVYYSNRYFTMLGYNPNELPYTPEIWEELLHPEDKEGALQKLHNHMQNHTEGYESEFRLKAKSGEWRWILGRGKVVKWGGDGEPERMVGTHVDITKRKKAEEELAETRALFQAAIEQSPAGIIVADAPDVKIRIANSASLRIRGKSDQPLTDISVDLHSKNWQTFRPDGALFASEDLPLSQAILEGKTSKNVEIIIRRDGSDDRWVLANAAPVRDEKGDISAGVVVFNDITERKLMEKAIRQSEEKYRHLIQYSNDAVYLLYNRKFELINPRFQEMLGFTLEEIKKPDFDFIQLVAPESRAMIEDRAQRMENGENLNSEYQFTAINKSGKEIELEASVSYIKYKDGIATQGILRDITERKKLEEQLRQAQKMEAVGRLAGGVAHDFNNLLTAITGYTQLLLADIDFNDKMYSDLNEIKRAADRAASLTHQLLAFSRKQILQPQILDLNSIIIELDKMLRRMIGEDIELVTILGPDIGNILADQSQIEQVIMNLAVNSRDAMPTGGKLIIETRIVKFDENIQKDDFVAPAGTYISFSISDNGVGISEESQSHLFEPFYTTKDVGRGTGLGLATVYGIVRQSGGFIDVHSKLGEGTTVTINFPHVAKTLTKKDEEKKLEKVYSGTETILLVEDEDIVRKLTRKILTGFGYNLLEASYGEDAIRIVHEFLDPIHLILSDVIMPKMSGVKMVEEIKKKLPEVKVLFISGYSDETISKHGEFDSTISFLQKPYSPIDLAKKIRKILD